MSVSKSYQAGSATSFVIIAIILVAATIGSIAYVVNRGEQVRKDQAASKIADQEAAQKAKDAADKAKATAAANKPTNTGTSGTSNTATTPTSTNGVALPETGAELDIIRIVAMALLAGTATSFIVSKRSLKRPL